VGVVFCLSLFFGFHHPSSRVGLSKTTTIKSKIKKKQNPRVVSTLVAFRRYFETKQSGWFLFGQLPFPGSECDFTVIMSHKKQSALPLQAF
jgi:hypothetical protein